MNNRLGRIGRSIAFFVNNPATNLVKGVMLVIIGISEASRTLMDDVTQKQLRVGHGLIIIGLFSLLESLPHIIDGLQSSQRYLDLRDKGAHSEGDSSIGRE